MGDFVDFVEVFTMSWIVWLAVSSWPAEWRMARPLRRCVSQSGPLTPGAARMSDDQYERWLSDLKGDRS